ncbi:MAG: arginyltransferase [Proteobacteria bacterium]|jgi:arginine-tRNA-protein transferase|nr:arginyltransferase [Pseudomonadota bacterium]
MNDLPGDKQFFLTPPHPCSYLKDRTARTLFLDPREVINAATYSALTHAGFRRSGGHLYRPYCDGCKACVPVRVPVAEFRWSRRFRRIRRANAAVVISMREAVFAERYFKLYASYIESRHADGDMHPPNVDQFQSFLLSNWTNSAFLVLEEHGQLLGVAVTDRVPDGLSAIYTFFDPVLAKRSLGVLAVLAQIEHCVTNAIPYLYLGYWVRDSAKMHYKTDYRPIELLVGDRWVRLS